MEIFQLWLQMREESNLKKDPKRKKQTTFGGNPP